MEKLKYPIGHFKKPEKITEHIRSEWISRIATLPGRLETALANMTEAQLDTPYRPGGWTVRQLIHHIADSHMNSFIRFRLALTEEHPAIKPYDEKLWAKLPDAGMPIQYSLDILRGLHARWAFFLKNLEEAELSRTYFHPESKAIYTVDESMGIYAHHGDHHLAQITGLTKRMDW